MLSQEVRNLWAWTSHPIARQYKIVLSLLSIHNVARCIMRFRKHTNFTCMTRLNNSCPLNIAVKQLRKALQRGFQAYDLIRLTTGQKGYRQLGLLPGAYQMSLCPCLCFSRPCPPECQPSPPFQPCWTPPSAFSSPLCSQAVNKISFFKGILVFNSYTHRS